MNNINDFITQKINKTITSVVNPSYQQTNMNMLLQKAQRAKSINGNYLFDFLQLERDPNFLKRNTVNRSKIEKLFSRLSTSTSILTTFTSLVSLTRTKAFIPDNIMELMYNYWSLADTGMNYLSALQDNSFYKQIGLSLLSDLMGNFRVGNITFNEIHAMSLNFFDALPLLSDVKNNGIRPLLSIPLNSLLSEDMLEIYSDLNYLDKLYGIFGDRDFANIFNTKVKNRVKTYSQEKPKNLTLSTNYEEEIIGLNDPLGFSVADQFKTDIKRSYIQELQTIVNEEAVPYELTPTQIEEILLELETDAEDNVEAAFSGNLGLPTIANSVNGINTEIYNNVVNVINNTFQKITRDIVSELNINPAPTDQKPFDYLLNLKRNLDARIKMKQKNAYSDKFVEIDNYLKSVVTDGNISESILDDLHTRLKTLLRDVENG